MKWSAFGLLIILSFHQAQPFIISAISAIYSIYQMVNDAHSTYSKFTTPSTSDLMDEILNIKDSVNKVTKEVSQKIDQLYEQLIQQLPRLGQINRGLETFSLRFNRIAYLYKNFEQLIRQKQPSERLLLEFSTVALSFFSDSVSATLDALHELFIPTEIGHLNDGLLQLLVENLENHMSDNVTAACNMGTPPEEQLYLIYTALVTAEIRGLMMQIFTYVLLENYSGESYQIEIENSKTGTLIRIQEYMWEFADAVQWSSRIFYNCDPPNGYKKYRTYGEFEAFMSRFIFNQYSTNRNCSNYCSTLSRVMTSYIHCAEKDDICKNSPICRGQLKSCYTFDENGSYACINDEPRTFAITRTYLYYTDSDPCGYESNCTTRKYDLEPFLGENDDDKHYRCDYCGCICVRDKFTSDNVFTVSFLPQIADIENNKVLAGVKLKLTNSKLLQLQIQQGELRSDSIAPETLEWKPLEFMGIRYFNWDPDISPTIYGDNDKIYKAEVDYGQLTWEHRDIYLDELVAPEGYVVTGVRFNRPVIDEKAIQLEIYVTPFDFGRGKLIINDDQPSRWVKPLNMRSVDSAYRAKFREQLKYYGKLPMQPYRPTEKVSRPYTWVRIDLSNSRGDSRGTVFPLVDLRNVTTPNPFLIEGVGLIYNKPVDKSEIGYIALSLQAMSRKKFFEIEVTSKDLELDDSMFDALAPSRKSKTEKKK